MTVHEVVTTERVVLRYRVAGLGSRSVAWLIDAALVALLLVAGALFAGVYEVAGSLLGLALAALWRFVLQWCYFAAFEWLWLGQTPGKRALGLRVIGRRGTSISPSQAAVRNILRVVDSLPLAYGLGGLVALGNRESRRLGDLAADTLVVHVERGAAPVRAVAAPAEAADPARAEQLRTAAARLTQEQREALQDLVARRDQLPLRTRARLFRLAARAYRATLGVGPAEFESDEKFVAAVCERPAGR